MGLLNREGMSRCLRTCEQGKTPGAWRATARFLEVRATCGYGDRTRTHECTPRHRFDVGYGPIEGLHCGHLNNIGRVRHRNR